MIALRALGIGMMAIQGILLWRSLGYFPISVTLTALAVLGCWPRLQVALAPRKRPIVDGVIAGGFGLWWLLWLQHIDLRTDQFGPNVLLAAALCCIALQAVRYYWRDPGGLGVVFPILGAVAAACAGDRYLSATFEQRLFFWGTMGHGALVVLYYAALSQREAALKRAYRAYRYGVIALCIMLSFLLASGTAMAIHRSDRLMQPWMMNRLAKLQRLALGNSHSTRLGSMTDYDSEEAERIALQVFSDKSPGYLRGQVYADYTEARWDALADSRAVAPLNDGLPSGYTPELPGEALYPVAPGPELGDAMAIYPDPAIRSALFLPGSVGWVGYGGAGVVVGSAGVAEAQDTLNGRAYRALSSPPQAVVPLSESEVARYTALPETLAARIHALSDSICAGRDTPLGKALAVSQYFTGNYKYSLDFVAPREGDPLERFLFEEPKPSAHCEYFASGATMLLRAAGVPARYVTGVVAWEQMNPGGYWVARNRDAHAWCEAWDPEGGWFTVEATPADGTPDAAPRARSHRLRDLWSGLKLSVRRLIAAVQAGAWPAVKNALGAIVLAITAVVRSYWLLLAGVGAVVAGALVWWRRHRVRRPRRSPDIDGVMEQRLATQLSAMDRYLSRRHRLTRVGSRTLHRFAAEIEEAGSAGAASVEIAAWYRKWAETRYQPRPDASRVDQLEADLESVRRS